MPQVEIKKCWQCGGREYSDTDDCGGDASFFYFSSFFSPCG